MARHREFEPEDVVRTAMDLFWERGYQATSMQDLVDATGVHRGSLYSAFRDKRDLFLRALERYRCQVVPQRADILRRPGAALPEIRAYFEAVLDDLTGPARGKGCLMVNSAVELAPHDPAVAGEVAEHLEGLERAFAHALSGAADAGNVADVDDIPALARFLTGAAQGLMVVGKAHPDRDRLRDIVAASLRAVR